MSTIEIIKNGKRIRVAANATAADLTRGTNDSVLRHEGSAFRAIDLEEPLKENDRLTTVPHMDKGVGAAAPSPWIEKDLALLRQSLNNRAQIQSKPINRDGHHYLAVEISNVRLNDRKFNGRTFGKMLFLLPENYPATPPIGIYVNYPYTMSNNEHDHHFTQRSHYGAPDLQNAGWYWYCLQPMRSASWRPGATPDDGHNLTSLFAAASHALNN